MSTSHHLQRARARSRARLRKSLTARAPATPPANDNATTVAEADDEFCAPDEFIAEAPASLEVTASPHAEEAPSALAPDQRARLAVALSDDEPEFDPPEAPDPLPAVIVDDEPPFDPPDVSSLTVGAIMFESDDLARMDDAAAIEASRRLPLTASNEVAQSLPPLLRPREAEAQILPLPPIAVHASWDRPEIADLLDTVSTDERVSRASIGIGRGGIDGAALHFASNPTPDLLILDTTLRGGVMLAALDRLIDVVGKTTKLIVIGAVNDVALLRGLTARGVCEYLVAPVAKDDLIAAACRLFEDTDKARVVAVIGARGGVGASTLALNLAWSIAERQQTPASILDLDLSFGTAAFTFHQEPQATETKLLRVLTHHTSRLEIMAAPTRLDHDIKLEALLEAEMKRARRASAYVILDLPHAWTGWVRQVLLSADDVVIVATPDLASLASTKALVDVLKGERGLEFNPLVALSMAGIPKRPQIEPREFASALGAAPVVTLPFDPNLFGMAAIKGQMIGEAAPRSKPALAIDALATAITGREPVYEKQPEQRMAIPEPVATPDEPPAEATTDETPAPDDATETPAPLELTQKLPAILESPYLTRARASAQVRKAQPKETRRHDNDDMQRPGRVARMAVCSIGILVLGGIWFVNRQSEPAEAAQPAVQAPIALTETTATPQPDVPPPLDAAAAPAAAPADAVARFQFAKQLLDGGQRSEGIEQLRRSADAGYAPAQYRLAKFYEHGDGVEADLTVARQWSERAASSGNVRAMHDLGVYFARGDGGRRDEAAAFRWFRQAAEFGVSDSQYNLGILYQQGRGVNRNAGEALFWYLAAAQQGDEQARRRATALEQELAPIQIEQARARAQAFRARTPNPASNEPVATAEQAAAPPTTTPAPED